MQLIDFDAKFEEMFTKWMTENETKYTPEQMEDEMPVLYSKFLNTSMDWLEGITPLAYFEQFSDSSMLIKKLDEYCMSEISVPDLLLDRLETLANEECIMELVTSDTASLEARMHAINLLRNLESTLPLVPYLRWQVERNLPEELLENSLDSLCSMGEFAKKPARIAFRAADLQGKQALLDILCTPEEKDEEIFNFTLNQFKKSPENYALYAAYLAKFDNDRALEALLEVAESTNVSYIDFIEIRSSIERLGGEAPIRDFSKDPTYRAVHRLQ